MRLGPFVFGCLNGQRTESKHHNGFRVHSRPSSGRANTRRGHERGQSSSAADANGWIGPLFLRRAFVREVHGSGNAVWNKSRPGGSTSDQAFKDFYLRVRKTGPDVKPISGTIFAQEVPADAKKLYEKGIDELESNRTEAGIQSLLNAVKAFPEYYVALERLGREYIKQQNYVYALAVFIKLVSVNEKSFSGWYGLSFAAYALKESGIAIEAAKRASTLEQGSVEAFLMLGIANRQAKNFAEAEKALLNARSLSKGQSADVHWNLALLYANNMNRFKEAADELEEYLKIAPEGTKTEEVKKLVSRFREKAVAANKFTQGFSF